MNFFHSSKHLIFPFLVVLMRIFFGGGWLLAGITKITDKGWFRQHRSSTRTLLSTYVFLMLICIIMSFLASRL